MIKKILTNISLHVKDIALSRSLRFTFYRLLHILNRRIQLPPGCFIGEEHLTDELFLEKYLDLSKKIVFLDIGAKVGLWSIKIAEKCKEIHAFEPNPVTNSLLRRNTRELKNLIIHPCALGDKNGFQDFFIHHNLANCGFVKRQEKYEGKIIVPVRTIDSFNFDTVNLIKVDTEGYELPILEGSIKTLEREKPQLFIEIHLLEQMPKIIKILKKIGYVYHIFYVQRSHVQPYIITLPNKAIL